MSDHIKRITIDLDGGATAQEALDILAEVAGKLGQCWADTTSGPIYDWTGKHTANAKVEKLPFDLQLAVHETDRRDAAIRHDERKRIIADGCIHTRKRDERGAERPDLEAWQAAQGEWFDPTILEIVTEYAEWRDMVGPHLRVVKAIAAAVVQSACETDPADVDHPDTIRISTDDLEVIVRNAVESSHG